MVYQEELNKHVKEIAKDLQELAINNDFDEILDYFSEIYNINYILDSDKKYIACRVMVACGGPNIYINTYDKEVELYWRFSCSKTLFDKRSL